MRKSFLAVFVLPLLAVGSWAIDRSFEPPVGSWSEESWGGSSYLGVDTRDITPDRVGPLHLKEEKGVEVTMVDQDAPAGKAGLKEEDVILTLNGTEVEGVEQLRRMIRETPPGRVVTLGISREGQPLSIKVQLADRQKDFAYAFGPSHKDFKFTMPAMPVLPDMDMPASIVVVHSLMRSGLMVENLTPQLGDFFGARNGQGVLVRSVDKGSRADQAGFRAGDVIVKVNGQPINDSGDFSHALRSHGGNTAAISVIRDKKEQTITLTLPERKQSDLYWESLEVPELDSQSRNELSQLQSEIARMKPEMEEAIHRQAAEIEHMKPEVERQIKDFLKQKDEFKKQMRDMQQQLHNHQHEIQRELRQELQRDDEI